LPLDEDQKPPPLGPARAAAAQPSVVRSSVGPLHRVSTCNPPPVGRPGAL